MRIPPSHRHLLAPSGRYPQRQVMIMWNTCPALVWEVEVAFAPREAMVDIDMDDPWFGFDDYVSEWDFAKGNDSTDWLTSEAYGEVVYNVCRECNNGWMSQLHIQVGPMVAELAEGSGCHGCCKPTMRWTAVSGGPWGAHGADERSNARWVASFHCADG